MQKPLWIAAGALLIATSAHADSCDDLRAAGGNSAYCTGAARTPSNLVEHATLSCAAGTLTADWCLALDIAVRDCAGDSACIVNKIGNDKLEVTHGVTVLRGAR